MIRRSETSSPAIGRRRSTNWRACKRKSRSIQSRSTPCRRKRAVPVCRPAGCGSLTVHHLTTRHLTTLPARLELMPSEDAPFVNDRVEPSQPVAGGSVRPLDSITRQSLFGNVVPFPVLLVEDKDSLRAMLRLALEGQGHTVIEARDETEARARLTETRPAVVLTDLKLPTGDGFGVLRAAKELDPELQVVVMTAYASIQDAVTAMKEGAMDFLAKPIDPEHLLLMLERAIAQRRVLTENVLLKEEL